MRFLLAMLLFGMLAAPTGATELGVQDDGQLRTDSAAVFAVGHAIGATWVRIIADDGAAAHIRDAHAAGYKVVLTVGGIGTRDWRQPNAATLLATIASLPRVERYTVLNEPDLLNLPACTYRSIWMRVRHVLGRRLMWGDYSPHAPVTHMLAAQRCGRIPAALDVAIHPYQSTDPLAAGPHEGSLGNLRGAARKLRQAASVHVRWVVDEFAYLYDGNEFAVTDERAAWLWPRALRAAARLGSPFMIVYMASGPTWDSRPRELSFDALSTL